MCVFELHSRTNSISIGSKVVFNKASVCVPESESEIRVFTLTDECISSTASEDHEEERNVFSVVSSLVPRLLLPFSEISFHDEIEEKKKRRKKKMRAETTACEADTVMAKGDE